MMRPMKLAGSELLFGEGSLIHLRSLKAKKIVIVLADDIMIKNGVMTIVEDHLHAAGIHHAVFMGVESDPGLKTVLKGASFMMKEQPDLILAIGGGSCMDAAKAMWIYYEHPNLSTLEPLMDKEHFPKLRNKARFACVPSTAGTASEVSRSIVITDDETGIKYGIGNMEMMPDIAICDPLVTVSMPPRITAETGMDAMVHALEALVSTRANYISDIFARQAILDGFDVLPKVYRDGKNMELRERMLNVSLIAGLAFTNVSLGIVHSIAHSLGSLFKMPHGLTNAILLPYVISFNLHDGRAKKIYEELAKALNVDHLAEAFMRLNASLDLPLALKYRLSDEKEFMAKLEDLITLSIQDGCTKTNPIIPNRNQFRTLILDAYHGHMKS
ncbi:MAG: iron-containing alcohol dehydrogenase [Acholeplasmataceae bacterium]|nr:iron-containing alcohol dehydrogenase [Acholeplasmataceae bacterium]